MASRLGAILNELGDVLSDALLYLPLALHTEICPHLLVIVVILGIVAEMTGVIGTQIGAHRRYDGPLGKSDRALAFGGLSLALGLGAPAGIWIDLALMALALLSLWTIINRARGALEESRP